ncbi:MAG: hypothetical protein PHV16_02535 [Candidatus Nanoarchaeia archaeon]|nr:hypothetical protein [Candidatus Nanoarchaeia archaeon]
MNLKKRRILAFFVIYTIVVLTLLFLFIFQQSKLSQNYIKVDYSESIGRINLDYGSNEVANWMDFVGRDEIKMFHRDAGSKFIRIWIDDPDYRKNSTIPYSQGSYDFIKFDSIVNSVLESDAIPFIVIAHAPDEMSMNYGTEENANPPINNDIFSEYCAEIVRHYKKACEEDNLSKKCNIDEWYWEIWNEPYWDHWWQDETYIKMYNQAYYSIKNVAPNTKVGGYTLKFLSSSDKKQANDFLEKAYGIDFISLHIYGNYLIPSFKDEIYIKNVDNDFMRNEYRNEMINHNKDSFFKQINEFNDAVKKSKNSNAEIIISELGPNWNWLYEPYFDEPFVSAWYASALNWMIKTNAVDKEFYYSGTSNYEKGGFAMWSANDFSKSINLFPVYHMKTQFVKYNKKGSYLYYSESNNPKIESIAVSNDEGYFITVINKKNYHIENIKINVENLGSTPGSTINLSPYEIKFIKIK